MKPAAFFGLTFSRGAGENRESFRVFVELDEEDADLLVSSFVNAKPRAIVRSAAILGFLPIDVDDDWSFSGTLLDPATKGFWNRGSPPTVLRVHDVWMIGHTEIWRAPRQ